MRSASLTVLPQVGSIADQEPEIGLEEFVGIVRLPVGIRSPAASTGSVIRRPPLQDRELTPALPEVRGITVLVRPRAWSLTSVSKKHPRCS